MAEPTILARGKQFHRVVQSVWEGTSGAENEKTIDLVPKGAKRQRQGRLDIFVDEVADEGGAWVTVVEIKSTNWDSVRNPKRLVRAHRRQVWRYIEKYLDVDVVGVCAGIIYPHAPSDADVKQLVVEHLHENALQVVWYYDDEVA